MTREIFENCEECGGTGRHINGDTCIFCNGRRGKWVTVPLDYDLWDTRLDPWENWVFLVGLGAAFMGIGVVIGMAITTLFFRWVL